MSKNEFKMLIIKLFVTLAYLIHLLVSKAVGILFLTILLYYFSNSLGLGEPFSFSELVLWLDQLPENSKTTIFTSIITISGFLVAFSIGSENQKQQLLSQMRVEASNDLEKFFNKASRNVTSADIYAKYLLEIINHINNSDDNTINFHLQNVIIETQKFLPIRSDLQEQAIEVHRFQGKYSIIFASSWGVIKKMKKAENAFSKITNNLWFNTPILRLDDPDIKQTYINQINIEQCNNYINAYKDNYDLMNTVSGALRGGMLGSITGLNFSFIINLLKISENQNKFE